jgi:transposase
LAGSVTQSSGLVERSGERERRRRRSWSEEEKKRIVEETLAPGASVSTVARRHDINANLLFTWRRRIGGGLARGDGIRLVPAVIAAPGAPARQRSSDGAAAPSPATVGRIEIVLVGGARIIVDRDVNGAALARVIGALERR